MLAAPTPSLPCERGCSTHLGPLGTQWDCPVLLTARLMGSVIWSRPVTGATTSRDEPTPTHLPQDGLSAASPGPLQAVASVKGVLGRVSAALRLVCPRSLPHRPPAPQCPLAPLDRAGLFGASGLSLLTPGTTIQPGTSRWGLSDTDDTLRPPYTPQS